MKKIKDEAEDILRDLDQMPGLGGKEWSVAYAKKLGLSAAEIEKYMAKQSASKKE